MEIQKRQIQVGFNSTTKMHTISVPGEGQISLSDAELDEIVPQMALNSDNKVAKTKRTTHGNAKSKKSN